MFVSTEDAENFGVALRRVLPPDDFQTLVRTWLVSQHAASEAPNPQAKVLLATRSQHLREAVQAFLFPDGIIRKPRSQEEALEIEVPGSPGFQIHPPSSFEPLEVVSPS